MVRGAIERATADPRNEFYLAIARPEDDRLIGFIRLGVSGVKAGKLGYALRADVWRQGFGTEATRLMLRLGFDTLGLHRISAAIGPDNVGSISLVESLGFKYEGRLRDHVFTNNAWRDSLLYSLLEDEWKLGRS
jgi:RimJ/RimL family protein N-acetyltransferase